MATSWKMTARSRPARVIGASSSEIVPSVGVSKLVGRFFSVPWYRARVGMETNVIR